MRDDGTRSQAGGVAVVLAGGLTVLLAVVVVGYLLLGSAGEVERVPVDVTDVATPTTAPR